MILYTNTCTGVTGGRCDCLVFAGITRGCRHGVGCHRWMEGDRHDWFSACGACLNGTLTISWINLHQGWGSMRRQISHHCLRQRLSLWHPPAWLQMTCLPAYWRFGLGAPNCNEFPNIPLLACSILHVLAPLFYVIGWHVIWLSALNDIFVWTQVVNELLLLFMKKACPS